MNAILNIILATLVFTRQVEPWHIYVTGFLAGTVQAFQQPARQTLISDLVPEHRLLNALAYLRRAFCRDIGAQFLVFHGGHVNVDVDAIEQWTGNSVPVFRDHVRHLPVGKASLSEKLQIILCHLSEVGFVAEDIFFGDGKWC